MTARGDQRAEVMRRGACDPAAAVDDDRRGLTGDRYDKAGMEADLKRAMDAQSLALAAGNGDAPPISDASVAACEAWSARHA